MARVPARRWECDASGRGAAVGPSATPPSPPRSTKEPANLYRAVRLQKAVAPRCCRVSANRRRRRRPRGLGSRHRRKVLPGDQALRQGADPHAPVHRRLLEQAERGRLGSTCGGAPRAVGRRTAPSGWRRCRAGDRAAALDEQGSKGDARSAARGSGRAGGRPGRELRGFRGYDRAARQEDRGAGLSMLLIGWAGR